MLMLSVACGNGKTIYFGSDSITPNCDALPARPPSELGLDPFYGKYLDASGIPIVSSTLVADAALRQACVITTRMLSKRQDVRNVMQTNHQRVAIIGQSEVTTDIPEYSDLPTNGPSGRNWDQERGEGPTLQRPVSSSGEENLLCLAGDIYAGESILVETVAYGFHDLGLSTLDPAFETRLSDTYNQAISSGLWTNTFAATDSGFYFAEGVQDWFDANQQADPPDGTNNYVNTRDELKNYDANLANLIAEYMPNDTWRPVCP